MKAQRIASLDAKFPSHKLLDACQNVSFLSSLIHSTLYKCLDYCVSDRLQSLMTASLEHSRACTEKLAMVLHQIDYQMVRQTPKPALEFDLIKAAKICVGSLRDLCMRIKDCLGLFVNILDPKHARHLVMNLHCAVVDLKEAWEMIASHKPPVHILSIQPTLSAPTGLRSNSRHFPLLPRARSASDHQAGTHCISSHTLAATKDSSQLFGHLRLAVTGSLHVIDLLNMSMETATGTESLKQKLYMLGQQAQQAIEMALYLSESLEVVMAKENDDNYGYKDNNLPATRPILSSNQPTHVSPGTLWLHKDTSRKLWEDTSAYLKSILSVMSSIRSISTEEDFAWPKPIKQGCLHVTRVTAEVAKLWNSYSVFAEHGYYLGR
ncbi:RAM signaling pathway protein-domain-containing protein [Phycomyces nitens]|nr:RAM signaling pathway protein-domain-containing protein [Phycomyces nitens]